VRWFATLLAVAVLPAAARAEDPAVTLARRVDAHHRHAGDLTAKFVQTYRSATLGRELVERGTLAIKRPGRMLWEYRDPERKTFLSDGKSYYFYVPADKQVIVRDQAGERGLPTLLLSGQGDILSQFEVGLETDPRPGLKRLRLVPRKPDPEVERVYLEVDAQDRIVAIEVFDAQDNHSLFRFDDVRENVGLGEQLFQFHTPKGVEVVAG
jgi:outer membrane lipoprotein carrier protein